jgi:GAF domain-containing protein
MSRRTREELESLLRAARAVLRHDSFETTARDIFDEARMMTGASAGYVALVTENGDENEVLFLEAGGAPCSVDPDLPMPIRGLRAESYRTGRAAYDNEFMHGEWARLLPEGHVAMRNVLFAPLNVEGRTVGILGLANKDGDFDDHDAELAETFGDLAATALTHSRNLDRLRQTVDELEQARSEVRTLRGIIPICAHCKKVRDEDGYWRQVEEYVRSHSQAKFSHGLCQECVEKYYSD